MKKRKTRRTYGEGSIFWRGGVVWIRWREVKPHIFGEGRYVQHQESTGSADVEHAKTLLRSKINAQGGRRQLPEDPNDVTYEMLRASYLRMQEDKKRRSLKRNPDGSLRRGADGLPTLATLPRLDRRFRLWKAADITTEVLEKFRAEGLEEGLSDARLNRYIATIRAMFRCALKKKKITQAEMPTYFPTVKESDEAVGAVFIEDEWAEALFHRLTEPLRSAFWLSYKYAVRVQEAQRLRWRDISLERRVVTIPASVSKTGKARTVPLPKAFGLIAGQPDELVFQLRDHRWEWYSACVAIGAGHFECATCRKRCEGMTCPDHGKMSVRRLHYMGPLLRHTRHTAIRNMSERGMSDRRIMAISGHKTRSTFDRYNINRDPDIELAREVVEG